MSIDQKNIVYLDRYGQKRALTRCATCGALFELAADWPCPHCLRDEDLAANASESIDLELATA